MDDGKKVKVKEDVANNKTKIEHMEVDEDVGEDSNGDEDGEPKDMKDEKKARTERKALLMIRRARIGEVWNLSRVLGLEKVELPVGICQSSTSGCTASTYSPFEGSISLRPRSSQVTTYTWIS